MSDNKKTVLFDIENILHKIAVEEGQKVAELGCGNFGFFVWIKSSKNFVGNIGSLSASA